MGGHEFLEVLKLQSFAFREEKWKAEETRFLFGHLLIEDTDLVPADEIFPRLARLTMKKCYKSREIPLLTRVENIELHDCNPLAEARARQNVECDVQVQYSWE